MTSLNIQLTDPDIDRLKKAGVCVESGFYLDDEGDVQSSYKSKKLSRKERSFLSLAVKVAHTSSNLKQHGCAIVKNGSVLSFGTNKWRNRGQFIDEVDYNPNLTVHAEADALNLAKQASGSVVYIARISRRGELRYSRPCNACLKRLYDAGVKRIIYTNESNSEEMPSLV